MEAPQTSLTLDLGVWFPSRQIPGLPASSLWAWNTGGVPGRLEAVCSFSHWEGVLGAWRAEGPPCWEEAWSPACELWATTSLQGGEYFKSRKEIETGLLEGRTAAPLREGSEGWTHSVSWSGCLLRGNAQFGKMH